MPKRREEETLESIVYIPPVISPKPLFFAIDNIDHTIDTPDGKDQLHGMTQVIFQNGS